jgi:hypothetical protein
LKIFSINVGLSKGNCGSFKFYSFVKYLLYYFCCDGIEQNNYTYCKQIQRRKACESNICATGVKGRIAVVPTIDRVAINKCFLGLLLNSGFLVLMTRTIVDAEITDSINHAVLN